jgi:hypothetical protein
MSNGNGVSRGGDSNRNARLSRLRMLIGLPDILHLLDTTVITTPI